MMETTLQITVLDRAELDNVIFIFRSLSQDSIFISLRFRGLYVGLIHPTIIHCIILDIK